MMFSMIPLGVWGYPLNVLLGRFGNIARIGSGRMVIRSGHFGKMLVAGGESGTCQMFGSCIILIESVICRVRLE